LNPLHYLVGVFGALTIGWIPAVLLTGLWVLIFGSESTDQVLTWGLGAFVIVFSWYVWLDDRPPTLDQEKLARLMRIRLTMDRESLRREAFQKEAREEAQREEVQRVELQRRRDAATAEFRELSDDLEEPLDELSLEEIELRVAALKRRQKYLRGRERKLVTRSLRVRILDRDKHTCQLCGAKAPDVPLHVDHIVPIAKGGRSVEENLHVLCAACNVGKSSRLLQSFKRVRRRPGQIDLFEESDTP